MTIATTMIPLRVAFLIAFDAVASSEYVELYDVMEGNQDEGDLDSDAIRADLANAVQEARIIVSRYAAEIGDDETENCAHLSEVVCDEWPPLAGFLERTTGEPPTDDEERAYGPAGAPPSDRDTYR
jgi:hypothetical protein